MASIDLKIFDQPVRIVADDRSVAAALVACYSAFVRPSTGLTAQPLEISIGTNVAGREWAVTINGQSTHCEGLSYLLYVVEKLMTIELQRRRQDLFFIHAAVLGFDGHCVVISGESGAGKSTLCWELCNSGFQYMSDELAPVNPDTMEVDPYPHAICLKSVTEDMTPLPDRTFRTDTTLHVPVEAIPGVHHSSAASIDSFFFLDTTSERAGSQTTRISKAEAAARIYANGLNQLAHDDFGLTVAANIASRAPCYLLSRGTIGDMRETLVHALPRIASDI